ncbi:MAG: cell division protein FtsA [Candidatus Marinimicrobia bacterium]|nr:cell division protein FtsA [Candidatus Neomarinimicrobiota bacterium]
MTDEKRIITGIDIGTTKIAVVIAEWSNKDEMKIMGVGKSPSIGLKRGVVVNISETVQSISDAIHEAEKQADHQVTEALVGITGDHVRGINYSGVITVNKNNNRQPVGQEISQSDIQRVLEHAQSINLSPDRRILHVLTQEFKVDDRSGIKNPQGLSGHRLEAKVHLVTSAINTEKDIRTCMEKAGVEILDFVLEPLASAYSVLDVNERDLGVVLIDIGGGTTDVIVYRDGGVMHAGAIPIGGANITNDIAYGLQTTREQAELIKCKHGSARTALADPEENITIAGTGGRDSKTVSQNQLASIIEPRMDEIFRLAKNEINKSNYQGENTFGIVLTGGGARLSHVEDLAQDIFKQPIKIGKPELQGGISEKVNNPRFSTAVGLIKYGIKNWESLDYGDETITSIFHEFYSKLKKLFNNWY